MSIIQIEELNSIDNLISDKQKQVYGGNIYDRRYLTRVYDFYKDPVTGPAVESILRAKDQAEAAGDYSRADQLWDIHNQLFDAYVNNRKDLVFQIIAPF